jgi:uncharacterized metal-binding protein YceD (DUF177 family)
MENLKVYVDRLRGGHTMNIDETLPPEFMELEDEELSFEEPVHVRGEAYLADEHLVVHLNIDTKAILPCSICNDEVCLPLAIKNIYFTEPLADIKTAIFDVAEQVRETVLLQTPLFTECHDGKCPERENIKKFLKPEDKPSNPGDVTHFPFADLDK